MVKKTSDSGATRLLSIAAALKDATDIKTKWKDLFAGALTTGRGKDFIRALKTELDEGEAERTDAWVNYAIAELAKEISEERWADDAAMVRIQKDIGAAMVRQGKKPDEDWPEDQDAPADLIKLWTDHDDRADELLADVLHECGIFDHEDKLRSDPVAFWKWFNELQNEMEQEAPKEAIDEKNQEDHRLRGLVK